MFQKQTISAKICFLRQKAWNRLFGSKTFTWILVPLNSTLSWKFVCWGSLGQMNVGECKVGLAQNLFASLEMGIRKWWHKARWSKHQRTQSSTLLKNDSVPVKKNNITVCSCSNTPFFLSSRKTKKKSIIGVKFTEIKWILNTEQGCKQTFSLFPRLHATVNKEFSEQLWLLLKLGQIICAKTMSASFDDWHATLKQIFFFEFIC